MLMMRKETGGAGMEEESWAAGLGWAGLGETDPSHATTSRYLHSRYIYTSTDHLSSLFREVTNELKKKNQF